MGLFAIIPATLLLVVSFFVLFTLRKIETQGLKVFGYIIAVLLWVGVALVLSLGIYTVSTGRHPMMEMMQGMMKGHMQQMMKGRMQGMMEGQMPEMIRGQKKMMMKEKMPATMQGEKDETMMQR